MKVVILCGGAGTRLKEETEFRPKPMLYVGDKPIIWHIMKTYAHYGYNEFVLALGYKADYIKDFFLNQKAFTTDFTLDTATHQTHYHFKNRTSENTDHFKITFVDTGIDTQPGERILRCAPYLPKKEKYFMVTYGDGVSDVNIKAVFEFHKKQKTIGTIIGVNPRFKFGLVKVDKEKFVSSFTEKPLLSDSWANGGYMIFSHKFLEFLRLGETEHPALKRLAKVRQLSLFTHTGFWYAVDTYKELTELNKMNKEQNSPWKIWE